MPTFRPSSLRVGSMRQRVTIQQPIETLDATGQPVVTWSNWLLNEPAKFEPTGGIEYMRGRQLEASTLGIFTVRYRDGYMATMRILHNGMTYGITAQNPVEGGRRYIEIIVKAVES